MTNRLDRRGFIETAGAAIGIGVMAQTGCATAPTTHITPTQDTPLTMNIQELINATPLVDTHEHLSPEAKRINDKNNPEATPAPDFSTLCSHYTDSDLQVAGLSREDYQKLIARKLSPREKWNLIATPFDRCQNTGYMRCMRESIRILYGEEGLRQDNCETISQKLYDAIQPGFYRHILHDTANIEYAHVNDLAGPVFRENEPQPDLLAQDIWIIGLGSNVNLKTLEYCAGQPVRDLPQAHAAIDSAFAKFAPRAIAVKDQCAYNRPLAFDNISDQDAAPLFTRFAQDKDTLNPQEKKALQDHLFRYCITKATESNLPVKLHTGYYAGHGGMPLARIRDNLTDLCPLFKDFPNTKFILMHIAYPYQDELIAIAKHYPNVYADMCWAWIINPAASQRFLKEFLMAAPASKILTFGADFIPVELVPGHAHIARQGIALTLTQLLQEHWTTESEITLLAQRIMNGNAHEIFDYPRTLKNWNKT